MLKVPHKGECVNIFLIEIQFLYSEVHESFVFQLGGFYIRKKKKKIYIYIYPISYYLGQGIGKQKCA